MRRILAAVGTAGRPVIMAVSLALLGLAAGGAYVAFGAAKNGKPKITSGPADPTNQTSAAFTYTNGKNTTFLCSLDGGAFTPCGSGPIGTTSYAGPLADGPHAFRVEAQVGASTTGPAVRTWTIDTIPPAQPIFKETPGNPTTEKKAAFRYRSVEDRVRFECKLDAASYASCGGSAKYEKLALGTHAFCTRATDKAGNVGSAACYTWQISAGDAPFTIAGSPLPGDLLYPGEPAVAINVVFTNPNATPITIQSATVSVSGTSASGCAAGNFTVTQQLTATPTVPAGSSRSLQGLGVPEADWPQLQMIAGGDQDACRNATVELTFAGMATG